MIKSTEIPNRGRVSIDGSSPSPNRLLQFKNRHQGERALLVCNGPSLNKVDFSRIDVSQFTVVGLNKIFLGFESLGVKPKYLVAVNKKVIEQSANEYRNSPIIKFLSNRVDPYVVPENYTTFRINTVNLPESGDRFSKDITVYVHEGWTVTHAALQILFYMGFVEVHIVGMDHRYSQHVAGEENTESMIDGADVDHFDPRYYGYGQSWDQPDLINSEISYKAALEAFNSNGRAIFDCTIDGACTIFPKLPIEVLYDSPDYGVLQRLSDFRATWWETIRMNMDSLLKRIDQFTHNNTQLKQEIAKISEEKEILQKSLDEFQKGIDRLTRNNRQLKLRTAKISEEKELLQKSLDELDRNNELLNKELSKERETVLNNNLVFDVLRATLEEERLINRQSYFRRFLYFLRLKNILTVFLDVFGFRSSPDNQPTPQKTRNNEDEVHGHLVSTSMTDSDLQAFVTPPGWNTLIRTTQDFAANNGLYVVPSIEAFVNSSMEQIPGEWIGFLHTPMAPPKWWNEAVGMEGLNAETIFNAEVWKQAKRHCRGIVTFSMNHRDDLAKLAGVRILEMMCPLPETDHMWSWQAFKTNPNKRIIQVGWWMQRMHAIYMLPESDYEKGYIMNFSSYANQVFEKERQVMKQKNIYFDFMKDSVVHIEKASNAEYLDTLSGNIAFVHYHDINVPGLVLECVATHTPVLVNALPSVIEYLGHDYPLYYYSYLDAVEKAKDIPLIQKAHEHLKKRSQKEELRLNHFTNVLSKILTGENKN